MNKKPARGSAARKWKTDILKFGVDVSWVEQAIRYLTGDLEPGIYDEINRGIDPDNIKMLAQFIQRGRSVGEKFWLNHDTEIVQDLTGKTVLFRGYEWFKFKIPGGVYTPDYSYFLSDGEWIHFEIKESVFQPSYRDSKTRQRAVASLNPWFRFFEAVYNRKEKTYDITHTEPDQTYLRSFAVLSSLQRLINKEGSEEENA